MRKNKENAKRWRDLNPKKAKDTWLKYTYGITLDRYNEIFLEQNGVCAICFKTETVNGRSLCVDHNHLTGEVRGLLCLDCNSGIGHFKDNEKYLLEAIEYLKNTK